LLGLLIILSNHHILPYCLFAIGLQIDLVIGYRFGVSIDIP